MSIRVTTATITVGTAQQLEMARGEDREFRLTFQDNGTLDMTGAQSIVLSVRSRDTGALVFARSYAGFQGLATAGTPRFQVLQADLVSQEDGPYDCDVTWTDASGYRSQILVLSPFLVLGRVGAATDPVTAAPIVPVVYGFGWVRSITSTSYNATAIDRYLAVDTSAAVTVHLPTGILLGTSFVIFDAANTASGHNITISPIGTDTINGATSSVAISSNSGAKTLVNFATGKWMSY